MSDAYIIKSHSRVLGTPKRIYAFKNMLDAQLVREIYIHPKQFIYKISPTLHGIRKICVADTIANDIAQHALKMSLEGVHSEEMYYGAQLNGLDLEMIDYVVNKENELFLIGKQLKVNRKIKMDDFRLHFNSIYNKVFDADTTE